VEPRSRACTSAIFRVAILVGATLIGLLSIPVEAHAELLRNSGFERGTVGWTAHHSILNRVTPGFASTGAGRVKPRSRVAFIKQTATQRTTAGVWYRATAWARADRGGRLCLKVKELSSGGRRGSRTSCQRATGRWQALAPVTYRARGGGNRLSVTVYELWANPRSAFRVDRVHLKEVEAVSQSSGTGLNGAETPIKLLDSRSASDISCLEGDGSVSRGGLGDIFFIPEQPAVQTSRCTWHDYRFSHMGRYEVFDLDMRWDLYAQADSSHAGLVYVRPTGENLSSGCDGGGNMENIILRVYIDWTASPDRWMVDLRGGESPWPVDQNASVSRVPLGPAVEGEVLSLKFKAFFDYSHGAMTIWRNGVEVYTNLDRPLGFHYDCTYRGSADGAPNAGATDVSDENLRVQHGIYRNTSPAWRLASSGFRFFCSQTTPC
jgi:hypothetical protein